MKGIAYETAKMNISDLLSDWQNSAGLMGNDVESHLLSIKKNKINN